MRSFFVAAVLVAGLTTSAQAQFSSTFNSNNENWRLATVASPFNTGSGPAYPGTVIAAPFLGLVGNPAGSIGYDTGTEPVGYQYFLTPLAWNGNRSSFMHGTIAWQYRWTTTTGSWTNTWGDIAIRDTANNRWIVADVTTVAPPQSVWNTFSVNLDTTGGWRIGSTAGAFATNAQILAALTNMGGIYVRGEVRDGQTELYQLDNFRMQPIPEAGTMASLGAFLSMGFLWFRRRITA